jgi:protein phosphatase
MRFGVKSDKVLRDINEDSYNIIAGYASTPVSFLIADGMGGHNSGEIASKMAVDLASSYILKNPENFSDENNILDVIQKIMKSANSEIFNSSNESPEDSGMGTTLILAIVKGKRLFIGHIGDSRLYLLRGNEINRITIDHSYIEELIQSGSLTREEASEHPNRNIITRALGSTENVEIDTYISDICDDDIFMLCTDGLTNILTENEIMELVGSIDDPQAACDELMNKAILKGADDNITVILFKN